MSELTQHLPDLQPIGWLGVIISLCVLVGYGFKVIRALVTVTRSATEFFDDWRGEEPRAGVEARPGVLERISRLETSQAEIKAQLHTNGGMSLRDQTDRIEKTLDAHIIASTSVDH